MNIRYVIIGIIFVVIGIWLYGIQSLLPFEEDASPQKLILKEGTIRTDEEVAQALAHEMEFDLEGAYKTGYTTGDVIDFLMKEPHKYPVSAYQGKYYEGRVTVIKIIPLTAGVLCIITGVIILLLKGRSRERPETL